MRLKIHHFVLYFHGSVIQIWIINILRNLEATLEVFIVQSEELVDIGVFSNDKVDTKIDSDLRTTVGGDYH